jgi:hypothetical protein
MGIGKFKGDDFKKAIEYIASRVNKANDTFYTV